MTAISDRRLKAAIGFIFVTAVLDIVAMGIIIPVLPQLIEDFVGFQRPGGRDQRRLRGAVGGDAVRRLAHHRVAV